MKIAITTKEDNMDSLIPMDLQHANYLLIVNTGPEENFKFIPNMYNRSISGDEIFCSQFLIKQEIELLICGKYSCSAKDLLILAGIKTIEMPNTEIRKALNNIYEIKESNDESTS